MKMFGGAKRKSGSISSQDFICFTGRVRHVCADLIDRNKDRLISQTCFKPPALLLHSKILLLMKAEEISAAASH